MDHGCNLDLKFSSQKFNKLTKFEDIEIAARITIHNSFSKVPICHVMVVEIVFSNRRGTAQSLDNRRATHF